jgi:hypothetical protein
VNSYDGKQAVEQVAMLQALHDGEIRSIALYAEPVGVILEAICIPRTESPVKELRLRFAGVSRFDFQWSEDEAFYFIPGYKAVVQDSGRVYFSLDPYDDRETAPDPRDGGVIEARSLSVEFTMKK